MRHGFTGTRALRRTRVVWSVLAAVSLLIGLGAPAQAEDGAWDPTLPPTISAGAPGDPVAMANQSLQATAQATQTTLGLGQQFLSGLGINLGPKTTSANGIPRVYGRQAVEYVIRRGSSQMGVPYSWGGGTPNSPSKGIDSGANTVGVEGSGLVRYSFAGVGVLLARVPGVQDHAGRHI